MRFFATSITDSWENTYQYGPDGPFPAHTMRRVDVEGDAFDVTQYGIPEELVDIHTPTGVRRGWIEQVEIRIGHAKGRFRGRISLLAEADAATTPTGDNA